jgi:hypothetical protein
VSVPLPRITKDPTGFTNKYALGKFQLPAPRDTGINTDELGPCSMELQEERYTLIQPSYFECIIEKGKTHHAHKKVGQQQRNFTG